MLTVYDSSFWYCTEIIFKKMFRIFNPKFLTRTIQLKEWFLMQEVRWDHRCLTEPSVIDGVYLDSNKE